VLLDTHALLWWLDDDGRLPDSWRTAISDPTNQVLVSAVTVAEIAFKSSIGKLDAPADLLDALGTSNLDTLPLQAGHAAALRDLPWHHRDPFDRLLIAQATVEDLAVASLDRSFTAYDIRVLPA
jgi:PIN domain nuclease of toxin-antitoxin system